MPSQDLPTECRRLGEEHRYFGFDYLLDKHMPYTAGNFKQSAPKNGLHGIRKTTWILGLTFFLVLVLAIIAASFAASQAAKGRKAQDQCIKDKEALMRQIPDISGRTCNGSCAAIAPQTTLSILGRSSATTGSAALPSESTIFSCTSTASLSTTTITKCPSRAAPAQTSLITTCPSSGASAQTSTITTCPSSAASAQTSSLPSLVDDCSSLNTPYTATNNNGQATFQIYCGTDWQTSSDLLEVYVYTFEDCVRGCASYNYNAVVHNGSLCYGVTWDPSVRETSGGNCNWRYQSNPTLVTNSGVDTALLLSN